jgi:hypothetical protein
MSELNDIFHEFACSFTGKLRGKREIAFSKRLQRDKLDFSLESLHTVDKYLEYLDRNKNRIEDDEWPITVLWGGAYVGEVMRLNARMEFNWVDYDEYMPSHPDLKRLIPERTPNTCAFLCADNYMTMPLNKVTRFIDEGPVNSVHYYASIDVRR